MGGIIDIRLPANQLPELVVRVSMDPYKSAELVRRIQAGEGKAELDAWLKAIGDGVF